MWGVLSAQVGAASVAALPVVVGHGPSQCGWFRPPKVAFSLPQVLVPSHASRKSTSMCVYLCIDMSLYVLVVVGGYDL